VELIAPVVATTSTILCFNEHRLTQVHLEMEREEILYFGTDPYLIKIIIVTGAGFSFSGLLVWGIARVSSSCHTTSLPPINSRMEIFWYQLTWVVAENGS